MKLSKSWLCGASLCLEGKADGVIGRIYPDYESSIPRWLDWFLEKKNGNFCYFGILDFGNEIKEIDPKSMFGGNTFLRRELIKISENIIDTAKLNDININGKSIIELSLIHISEPTRPY